MAKIFGIEGGSQVPSLSEAIQPTLNIPLMEFDSIASALDSYAAFEENDIANAEENFNNITEFHDKLIGEKFDTERQKEVFEKARKDVGIDDDAFRVSLSDLRDSYKMRGIRSKVGQIYERADVQEIFHEQQRGKDYLEKIYNLKDMNPSLYKKALSKYNQYREGKLSGFDLLPQEFQPIDVTSTIAESLKLVPQIETSDIQTKSGLAYEQIVKERSREAIDSVINRLNNNAAFRNNLEAMFTDESGKYNEEAADAYVEQMASEYAKQYIDIENVHQIKQTKTETPKEAAFTNLSDDIVKRGGDANEVLKNKAILNQIVDGNKIVSIDEDDTGVVITYLGPDDAETSITIPKTSTAASPGPTEYNLRIGVNKKTITSDAVKSYLEGNPKVTGQGWFNSDSENEGNKTKGFFKDGNFYTNDVKMIWDLGLVKRGTDSEDLEDFGFTREVAEDGEVMFKIPVKSNKADVAPQKENFIPNKDTIEAKLDSNKHISNKYPKGSEQYELATIFLASPKIQDGYFEDVYLKEDYQTYLDKVKTVAPLTDNGTYDLSKVHPDIKALLKTNPREKLEYLAHHHALSSGGFLKTGSSYIPGNKDADEQLKAAWKRIDKILEDNPEFDSMDVLKKIESDNSYDAVYSGDANSSAIGKYQILFTTHYDKIKKYISENLDKVPTEIEGGDVETDAVNDAETEADTSSNFFDADFKND